MITHIIEHKKSFLEGFFNILSSSFDIKTEFEGKNFVRNFQKKYDLNNENIFKIYDENIRLENIKKYSASEPIEATFKSDLMKMNHDFNVSLTQLKNEQQKKEQE